VFYAAEKLLQMPKVDKETLDYIIVAHNYGDLKRQNKSDTVPSIASRVKHLLKVPTKVMFGYDLLFGCPGLD
jgi:3-oxoacyl-[acyl-carrier-protein] synthase-3